MNRPPSPHPIKLSTILENYKQKTGHTLRQNYQFERVVQQLEDIKEIKDKLN
tara:strand:- start:224 stop:379 length:156 start_codon:yes stop_codon:yes gene_type:complete